MATSLYCHQCKDRISPGVKSACPCEIASYCSKTCQIDHRPVHERICTNRPLSPGEVWAIRILPNNDVVRSNEIPAAFFRPKLIRVDNPIFSQGELCPVSECIGIPLIIFKIPNGKGANEIAVKLRIETSDGFAPVELGWQNWTIGECIVVRQDRKPLTIELLEAMFSFNGKFLLSYPFDRALEEGWAPWQDLLTPTVWQMFAMRYYEEQVKAGRDGFSLYSPCVDS